MKTFYRILRFSLVSILVLPLVVPFLLYIALSLPVVQDFISKKVSIELSELLGTELTIDKIDIAPFNRVVLKGVNLKDDSGINTLSVGHLGVGVNIFETVLKRRPTITYVELLDADVKLYRETADSPLNIEPIIKRFKKNETQKKKEFDFAVNLLVIRRTSFSYDVLDAPTEIEPGRFDNRHIKISGLKADISAPVISDKLIEGKIKRFVAKEQSGLNISDLTLTVRVDEEFLELSDITIATAASRIALADIKSVSPLKDDFKFNDCLISNIKSLDDSYVNLIDVSPFLGGIDKADVKIDVKFDVAGNINDLRIKNLELNAPEQVTSLKLTGNVRNAVNGSDKLSVSLETLDLNADISSFLDFIQKPSSPLNSLSDKLSFLRPLGHIHIGGEVLYEPQSIDFKCLLASECGDLDLDAYVANFDKKSPLEILANVSTSSFNPSEFHTSLAHLTNIAFNGDASLSIAANNNIDGDVKLNIEGLEWDTYRFTDIYAGALFDNGKLHFDFNSDSPLLSAIIKLSTEINVENPFTEFGAKIENFSLAPFIKEGKYKDYFLSLNTEASFSGLKPDVISGSLQIDDIIFANRKDKKLKLDDIRISSANGDSVRTITLHSDILEANISGDYSFKNLIPNLKHIVSQVYPALVPTLPSDKFTKDFFLKMDLVLKEDTVLPRFFNLPLEVIYPITINSYARGGDKANIGLDIDIPYLRNKDKLIEDTRMNMRLDGSVGSSSMSFHTLLPMKDGQMHLNVRSQGASDSIMTDLSFEIERQKEYKGNIAFLSSFSRNLETNKLQTDIRFDKSRLVFNDSAWTVNPGSIRIVPGKITVNNLNGGREGQHLSINGVASADSADRLVVKLEKIDLDYIFETLNIGEAVQFGGRATGDFYGLHLLSKEPVLYTPRLFVKDLKYNNCVMGDGDIQSFWNNKDKSVSINAVISQRNGRFSHINGVIRPASEELDFLFKADYAPVGFMRPFMSAFTSEIGGEVSGSAHLYGTFKDLDMTGDIYAKDFSLKLDFTNTVYTTTDSVHINPGMIKFEDVVLKDIFGNTASLSGYVAHTFFRDPTFVFNVTDAKDLLVYDVAENTTEDPWYGRVFGDGKASVKGVPGRVDINVNMSTAPKSTFTFVLSDAEQALDYTFITLRDRDRHVKDSIAALDPTPVIVRKLRERMNSRQESTESVYAMAFEIDVTPAAAMNLIMDPVGGDKITAYGNGHIRMTYNSDGDLRMYGDYTINRGSYNFTLQDIIIKDFTIRDGSKISFLGDPYAAQLDITASYSVNANLSDLDKSFLEDRDLNRTNVPVDALLMVKGDMRQPDISFDLDFPTLNSDTYRKVRSIVSTEDMMNRQIIYLLALNKFYTPDYMDATRGNELVSVASSTISSQISSMLGQLSNNWSIAPAIRSDRGDFSDVEVDVALSSHLLNNRLLLNGNLGYRDKSLNNNSFIGDFDIRYLLNRTGTLQLKAYNRYNDQNYYLKSATTTQGIGIVIKKDFDNFFSFLRRKKKVTTGDEKGKQPNDSTKVNQ